MTNLTPSAKSSFLAGIALWCLFWATLFKVDEIAEACGLRDVISSEQCLLWIGKHRSASLLGTELFNFGTHGISTPMGVTFALGGTMVNVFMIYVVLPIREFARRSRMIFSV